MELKQLEQRIKLMMRGYIILVIALAVTVTILINTINSLHNDEHSNKIMIAHTRAVQKAGEPTGVCLREAFEAAEPVVVDIDRLIEKSPKTIESVLFLKLFKKIEHPLAEYIKLQSHRYTNATCP